MAKKTKSQTKTLPPNEQQVKPEPDGLQVSNPPAVEEQSIDKSVEVFLWLFAYSVLMFTLPFLGFYGVRNWLDESFPDLDTFQKNCYSVLTAVLVVNAIVAMYVLKAIREKDPPPLPVEDDQESRKDQ
ncbi:uncharacterized protein LOC133839435 [Drosophila sulfurigaster albostrigata]|uniref:uncharacterized protein LOC133839435 n=1 Tax=Drosophila sulfurigaster albostrigata TaxID=89887 RepID=UPI002D21C38D|nr:uncharacterized protein LOC133839435 [Drosophila sulfurigaster albostrigata]